MNCIRWPLTFRLKHPWDGKDMLMMFNPNLGKKRVSNSINVGKSAGDIWPSCPTLDLNVRTKNLIEKRDAGGSNVQTSFRPVQHLFPIN